MCASELVRCGANSSRLAQGAAAAASRSLVLRGTNFLLTSLHALLHSRLPLHVPEQEKSDYSLSCRRANHQCCAKFFQSRHDTPQLLGVKAILATRVQRERKCSFVVLGIGRWQPMALHVNFVQYDRLNPLSLE
jgi:hypothetical protein